MCCRNGSAQYRNAAPLRPRSRRSLGCMEWAGAPAWRGIEIRIGIRKSHKETCSAAHLHHPPVLRNNAFSRNQVGTGADAEAAPELNKALHPVFAMSERPRSVYACLTGARAMRLTYPCLRLRHAARSNARPAGGGYTDELHAARGRIAPAAANFTGFSGNVSNQTCLGLAGLGNRKFEPGFAMS